MPWVLGLWLSASFSHPQLLKLLASAGLLSEQPVWISVRVEALETFGLMGLLLPLWFILTTGIVSSFGKHAPFTVILG